MVVLAAKVSLVVPASSAASLIKALVETLVVTLVVMMALRVRVVAPLIGLVVALVITLVVALVITVVVALIILKAFDYILNILDKTAALVLVIALVVALVVVMEHAGVGVRIIILVACFEQVWKEIAAVCVGKGGLSFGLLIAATHVCRKAYHFRSACKQQLGNLLWWEKSWFLSSSGFFLVDRKV